MCKRLLFLLFICALTARAQDTPPSEGSIKELLGVTQVSKLLDGLLPQVEAQLRNGVREALKGQEVSPEMQARIDKSRTEAMAGLQSEMAWSKLEPVYLRIYQKSFTQAEINGMLEFYKTPVGQSMVAKMPVVLQTTMGEIQGAMAPMLQKVQRSQQDLVAQVQAENKAKK